MPQGCGLESEDAVGWDGLCVLGRESLMHYRGPAIALAIAGFFGLMGQNAG